VNRGDSGFGFRIFWLTFFLHFASAGEGSPARALFQTGAAAYRAGEFPVAATAFRQAAELRPASGTLQNLGSAEWQLGRPGPAVVAWEQALWLDPFNAYARENLRYARKTAQLESPELAWYEVVSTWLPVNWWAWLAGSSLWLAVGLVLLPGIFRARKRAWHQAVAAVGFAVFLLSVPAHIGVDTRSRIGFVLRKDTPLRLTPTQEAQNVTRLAGGEPARLERTRGNYLLIRTSRASGWVERAELGLISHFPLSVRSGDPKVNSRHD
jgi:tetratricopeptide (TPR) repeat protein